MQRLLRIGAFARLAGTSVKTLRFYANEGLLPPHDTDPHTGYRYYAPEQLGDAAKIMNLRESGFSLKQIRTLLRRGTNAARMRAAINAQRQALLREKALVESRLKVVDALASALAKGGGGALSAVRLKIVAPTLAHTMRRRVPHFGEPVKEMFEEAERIVAQFAARARRSPFLLLHECDRDSAGVDLEVCIPVTNAAPAGLRPRLAPNGGLACSLIYQGPYDQTDPLLAKMKVWLSAAKLRPDGPAREVYRRFGADQIGYALPPEALAHSAADYVTELQIPVALPETDEE